MASVSSVILAGQTHGAQLRKRAQRVSRGGVMSADNECYPFWPWLHDYSAIRAKGWKKGSSVIVETG